ncbi:MAG: DUF1211 domain-containing protein [Xanthomonadales bacterium]|jgi:uncharacterized membrane protein|nr:DUF1211 domain-containing protein [Xanthomonadales bacterium]
MKTNNANQTLKDGFSRRGRERTRLETFIDAAFAFALTMLVISIDSIPENIQQLLDALKNVPAFGTSFALIMAYWRAHQVWSERYGLEDLPSVLLSSLLIFVIMVYVYPLKILFGTMFHAMTDGWLASRFAMESYADFRNLLVAYGIGFCVLNLSVAALYWRAWSVRSSLSLNALEQYLTRSEILSWVIIGSFGLYSIALACWLDNEWTQAAAWMYWLLLIVMPIYNTRVHRKAKALQAQLGIM